MIHTLAQKKRKEKKKKKKQQHKKQQHTHKTNKQKPQHTDDTRTDVSTSLIACLFQKYWLSHIILYMRCIKLNVSAYSKHV